MTGKHFRNFVKRLICLNFQNITGFIGPYFKYRTYWDLFNHHHWKKAAFLNILLKKIRVIPALIICYLVTKWMFPLSVSKY